MLFNSYPFLLAFLPAAILLYRFADPHPRLRIPVLVLLSFIFYGYWNPPFVVLLALSIVVNWLAARAYSMTGRGIIVTVAIVANLAVLGVFKYANFVGYNLGLLLDRPMPQLDIVLPLGISFFTFHHIMYLVDLRRGKAPSYALDRYALYISFFPQAIAGPLARWSEVMHQFGRQVYSAGWQREFAAGAGFIVMGLFEKIVLGDRMAQLLDPIYAQAQAGPVPGGQSWLALSFNFQILFDFAGYSDIAIGLGLLFGIHLPYNFNAPFRSINIQEFWQRWHITLMLFLRDYVFVPLADARVLHRRFRIVQYFAAMLATMALCGLWHGANWTFVVWGVLHGCALVVCSLWRRYCPKLPWLVGWALTVLYVLLTGVIFRAGTLQAARHIFQGLAVAPDMDQMRHALPILISPLLACLPPASQEIVARLTVTPRPWLAALLGVVMLALLIELGDQDIYEFAYFKF
ncbi:MBOAT family O-acyltransferase [Bradyrhizobium sp. dw_78]|uniref:MBOAT family O-acyltransferase n=1 Tax=Bradyrhizobium sp. dw_78 TaxID=2719793 RepID=UPI001BD5F5FD|nr:MBOAT family O-acyltransferase [Bradyrhizobium sp. dw_78]